MVSRTLYKVLGIATAIALAVALRDVLLVIVAGVVLGVVFSFPVGLFSKWVPRGLAVILTLFLGAIILGGVGYLGYRPISSQFRDFQKNAPQAIAKAKTWIHQTEAKAPGILPKAGPGSSPAGGGSSVSGAAGSSAALVPAAVSSGGKIVGSTVEILAGVLIVVVLAAFFSHEPDTYRKALRVLVPREHEEEFDSVWQKLGVGLRHWVAGILISMTIMGTLTAIALWIVGIQAWPLLGFLTFLGTFIPYVGAIASAVPGLLLGLAQSGSQFVAALCVYVGVHVVEGYIVQPLVMKRAVIIRPAFLLIWQLVMGALCGLLGVIVATPFLVCVQIVVAETYVRRRLGKKTEVIEATKAA